MKKYDIPLILSWLILLTVGLFAIVPSLFTSYNPLEGIAGEQLKPPSLTHLFGTDSLGRDLFSRVVYGSIYSLSGAFIAVFLGLTIGSALGMLAGALGGKIEATIMRFIDILLAIPNLLLSLCIIILLGFGELNIAIAIGFTAIAGFARLTRSEVLRVKTSQYVEAAFCSGGTFFTVFRRHILPNSLSSIIAFSALQFGSAILQMSTLGFLGYGVTAPTPEWGLLIAESRNYIAIAWWLTTMPGIVIIITVLAVNYISRSLNKVY